MSSDASEEAGSSGGKILLIVGLVLGLALGGGGAFVLLQTTGAHEAGNAEAEKKKEPEIPKETIDLDFERLTVPVYGTQRGRRSYLGNYLIDLRLQFIDEEDKIRADRSKAKLRHNFLSEISNADLSLEEGDGQIDLDLLREKLLARTRKIVGNDHIYDLVVVQATRLSH